MYVSNSADFAANCGRLVVDMGIIYTRGLPEAMMMVMDGYWREPEMMIMMMMVDVYGRGS